MALSNVLLCYSSLNSSYVGDVKQKLNSTKLFQTIDMFDCRLSIPTLDTLKKYAAVLIWSDFYTLLPNLSLQTESRVAFANPTLLGDYLVQIFFLLILCLFVVLFDMLL